MEQYGERSKSNYLSIFCYVGSALCTLFSIIYVSYFFKFESDEKLVEIASIAIHLSIIFSLIAVLLIGVGRHLRKPQNYCRPTQ